MSQFTDCVDYLADGWVSESQSRIFVLMGKAGLLILGFVGP